MLRNCYGYVKVVAVKKGGGVVEGFPEMTDRRAEEKNKCQVEKCCARKKKKRRKSSAGEKERKRKYGEEKKLFYIAHRHKSNSALKRIIERRNRLYPLQIPRRPSRSSIIKTHTRVRSNFLGNFLFDYIFIVIGESLSPWSAKFARVVRVYCRQLGNYCTWENISWLN